MAEKMRLLDLRGLDVALAERGFTNKELAAEIGWAAQTIVSYRMKARRGQSIKVSRIAALAWFLGVAPERLIKDLPRGSKPEEVRT